jgi:hypothetical protein
VWRDRPAVRSGSRPRRRPLLRSTSHVEVTQPPRASLTDLFASLIFADFFSPPTLSQVVFRPVLCPPLFSQLLFRYHRSFFISVAFDTNPDPPHIHALKNSISGILFFRSWLASVPLFFFFISTTTLIPLRRLLPSNRYRSLSVSLISLYFSGLSAVRGLIKTEEFRFGSPHRGVFNVGTGCLFVLS